MPWDTVLLVGLISAACAAVFILSIRWFYKPWPEVRRRDINPPPFFTDPYRTPPPPYTVKRQARQIPAVTDDDKVLDPDVPALIPVPQRGDAIKRYEDDLPTTTPHLEQMRAMLTTYTDNTDTSTHRHSATHHHDHGSTTVCPEAPSAHSSHDTTSSFDHNGCSTDWSDSGGGFDGGGHH